MKLWAGTMSGDVGSGEKGLHEGIPFLTTCLCEASLVVSAGRAMRLSLSLPLLSLHARVHLHLNITMIMSTSSLEYDYDYPMVHNMHEGFWK